MLSNAKAAGDIGALIAAGVAGGFAGGVANGLLNGASLGQSLVMGIQGAIFGGISAGLAYGIGHQMGVVSGNVLLRSIAHGITRGIMNTAIGGNFRSGFMSAFASESLGSLDLGLEQGVPQMIFHALVGGTVSQISGGKFANGAVSAAVVYLFNDMVDNTKEAMKHYFSKSNQGEAVNIGSNTKKALLGTDKFKYHHNRILMGMTSKMQGNFSVDMANIDNMFYIGRTNVDYVISCVDGSCTVKYDLFVKDGFWDVDFVDEYFGKQFNISHLKVDGMGPNLERFGGQPYPFIPTSVSYQFNNPGY